MLVINGIDADEWTDTVGSNIIPHDNREAEYNNSKANVRFFLSYSICILSQSISKICIVTYAILHDDRHNSKTLRIITNLA